MNDYYSKDDIVVGIDEAGLGPLVGPVYIAGVILPLHCPFPEKEYQKMWNDINDSKKMKKVRRLELFEFIKKVAIDYSIVAVDNETIDRINPRNARLNGFHQVIDNLRVRPDMILVDGDCFNPYIDKQSEDGDMVPHECVVKGDSKYKCIAAASILAKVSHDLYLEELSKEFDDCYNWTKNQGYGTECHTNAIKLFGITKYHRKTYGICKEWKTLPRIFI